MILDLLEFLTSEKWDVSNFGGWKECHFQSKAVGDRLAGGL